MHRRNQKFSRKRFFQDLQKEETSASKTSDVEHGHTKEQLEAGKNALEENTDNKLQLKSRKSARKRFFQNMKIPVASETSMNKDNEADADNQSITRLNETERSTIFGSIPVKGIVSDQIIPKPATELHPATETPKKMSERKREIDGTAKALFASEPQKKSKRQNNEGTSSSPTKELKKN